ncbi:hypothetical protein FRACA_1380017 [Frankia canadensis]|uniref:Uncharacterized protein n=1 Tax=Frankia canadensis TaxID=1836972 RepID=A0A2I2KL27_9ACTN|nr:hypothetical protein FRACA_1380017 [Frankia canadensis]SOU53672.1 hypothetical protein FRACA_1380017 [Frankia canadensis]
MLVAQVIHDLLPLGGKDRSAQPARELGTIVELQGRHASGRRPGGSGCGARRRRRGGGPQPCGVRMGRVLVVPLTGRLGRAPLLQPGVPTAAHEPDRLVRHDLVAQRSVLAASPIDYHVALPSWTGPTGRRRAGGSRTARRGGQRPICGGRGRATPPARNHATKVVCALAHEANPDGRPGSPGGPAGQAAVVDRRTAHGLGHPPGGRAAARQCSPNRVAGPRSGPAPTRP